MSIVIHHNPDCGTSRNVLAFIRATGAEPVVIDYLQEGWTQSQLLALFAAAGLSPRRALRTTKSPAADLGLLDPSVSDTAVLKAMLEHPVLVNRPIVCTPEGCVCAALRKWYFRCWITCRRGLCRRKTGSW